MNPDFSTPLWRLYRRPDVPALWVNGGNLPWNEPAFSERMLREHQDESHGAASRVAAERALQLDWLWERLALRPGHRVLDLTCGPGFYATELARRGCTVTGVDFGPASIAYARELAAAAEVTDRVRLIEADVRDFVPEPAAYDAALFIYGQLAVFPPSEAAALLARTASALRPGGRLVVELLNADRVDKNHSRWWFTDDKGLWGDRPFLHLGERFWIEEARTSAERYFILDLETAATTEFVFCDQTYAVEEMVDMMRGAGFAAVSVYPAWDGLPLYDAAEWIVYIAGR